MGCYRGPRSNPGAWMTVLSSPWRKVSAGLVALVRSCDRMPRIQTVPDMERRKVVQTAQCREVTRTELCRRFGISLKPDRHDAAAARRSGLPAVFDAWRAAASLA